VNIVVHADESCLRNGMEPPNPGGSACLIEYRAPREGVVRRDLWISSSDTTNNRMALSGAIECLTWLARKGKRLRVRYVSDSQYLIKGMREWIVGWEARGWKRKGGAIENLELWRALQEADTRHDVQWEWVRGHAGHPKNEYANWLAIRAAKEQTQSKGLEQSSWTAWLEDERARGRYEEYDPDAEL